MVGDFPETLHQTRDNTDFPRPLRKSEARLRLACPPSLGATARRTGGGDGGESDPIFGAGAPPGRVKGDRQNDTLTLPFSGGRSLHIDACGKASQSV